MKHFELSLSEIQTYPPKRKPRPNNKQFVRLRLNFEAWMQIHSGNALFLTFGLGKQHEISIQEEWHKCWELYKPFVQYLFECHLIGGVLTGIERVIKSKDRKTRSKAFRPHIHRIVFIYNHFLQPPKSQLEIGLATFMDAFKVPHSKTPQDAAKAAC